MRGRWHRLWLGSLGLGIALATPAQAGSIGPDVFVRVVPASQTVDLGAEFSVDIVADFDVPILGWGLDLDFDTGALTESVGSPVIGPDWIPVSSADGDGLAGAAFPSGIMGTDILLATVTLTAGALGLFDLVLGTTPGDLTEGFAIDPTGFGVPEYTDGEVLVPEPSTAALLLVGLVVLGRRSRP